MKLQIKIFCAIFIALIYASLSVSQAQASTLKTLLVTGQNNHKWKASAPELKKILEQTRLFDVDVATSLAEGEDMKSFSPGFAAYDVIVLDYNGDAWPAKTQKAFVDYVKSGGGVVVYHAADNSFPEWEEFNEIIGLGGWGNRNEKSGPYVYMVDGKVVRDTSPGSGGTHGPQSSFQVINRDVSHPITNGLPVKWMHAKDELYSKLRGPAKNMTVLATAYSDPSLKGAGRHEPVLFTIKYGKGRIFHTVLGHVGGTAPYPAIECSGFIVTFLRGAEWAATGKVSQKIPADFPNAVTIRKWPEGNPPVFKDVLNSISDYDYDQSREQLSLVADMISVSSKSSEYARDIEKTLNKFLKSDATLASKQFVCRQLNLMGTEASVSTLASLLQEPETFDMARYALERIQGAKVNKALRKTLSKLTGKEKAGIIYTLGNRGDVQAIKEMIVLLGDSDVQIAAAAALGEIATEECAAALIKAKSNAAGPQRLNVLHACLNCADSFMAQGKKEQALAIYKELNIPTEPPEIQSAAFRGVVIAAPSEAGDIIIDVIKNGTVSMQKVAAGLVNEISEPKAIESIAAELPNLTAENQARVLPALSTKKYPSVLKAVIVAAENKDPKINLAALAALGSLGDDSIVDLLARRAAFTKGKERELARESLYRLSGQEINAKILKSLAEASGDESNVNLELIRAVDNRRILAATDVLLKTAGERNRKVRTLSAKVLKNIADANDVPALVDLLLNAQYADERRELERTVATIAAKIPGDKKSNAVFNVLPNVELAETRASLYTVLGKLGEEKSLPFLKNALTDEDLTIRRAVIGALSEWPDSAPKDDIFQIAETSSNETEHILAMRGYMRLIGLESDRPVSETNVLYEKAMALSANDDDRKLVLAGLANVKTVEALHMVADYLNHKAIEEEAEAAIIKITANINDQYPVESKKLLLKIIEKSNSDDLRKNAQNVLNIIERLDDYITLWQLSGPYVNEEVNIFDHPFAPESPDAKDVSWTIMPEKSDENNYWYLDLRKVLGGFDRVAYLRTRIWSDNDQSVVLEMGSNDGLKAWLNDAVIHVNDANRGATPGDDVVEVTLNSGWNVLMMKIVNGGGGWGACARFRRLDGGKLDGLRVELSE
jgi:uncharacterized protein